MSAILSVRDLRRSFRSVKKQPGLKGAIRLLLHPEYQTQEALKGITFEIEEGSFVGLVGANGAGKTTLLKILSGLIPPTSGEARVLGQVPFRRTVEFRKSISLVMGQKAQLWWDLPAIDAFDLLKAIYQIPSAAYQERLEKLSSLLDVKKLMNTQIRRLSLGERMKMEIIGAILHWPRILFLDEPTIGLDVLAAHKLREFLREYNQQEKITIILTSHNMDDIEKLCSRVMLIREGKMIYDGSPDKLVQREDRRLRVRLKEESSPESLSAIAKIPAERICRGDPAEEGAAGVFFLEVKRSETIEILQRILARAEILEIGFEEASLEQVIQRIYENPDAPALS